MARSPRTAHSQRPTKRPSSTVARSAAGLAGRRSDWRPSSAAPVITWDVPAGIPAAATLHPGVASGRDWLDDEWWRLWAAAPEEVRYHFSRILNRLAVPRVILHDNLLPGVERRVEALLALHARRLAGDPPGGGK